jgi:hypothetical protein
MNNPQFILPSSMTSFAIKKGKRNRKMIKRVEKKNQAKKNMKKYAISNFRNRKPFNFEEEDEVSFTNSTIYFLAEC